MFHTLDINLDGRRGRKLLEQPVKRHGGDNFCLPRPAALGGTATVQVISDILTSEEINKSRVCK